MIPALLDNTFEGGSQNASTLSQRPMKGQEEEHFGVESVRHGRDNEERICSLYDKIVPEAPFSGARFIGIFLSPLSSK
jgi:hypothetical protein